MNITQQLCCPGAAENQDYIRLGECFLHSLFYILGTVCYRILLKIHTHVQNYSPLSNFIIIIIAKPETSSKGLFQVGITYSQMIRIGIIDNRLQLRGRGLLTISPHIDSQNPLFTERTDKIYIRRYIETFVRNRIK